MANFNIHHPWAFTFGILGNIVSFMVYLAPLPTFYRIYKKKSTEGFQSVPYVVALFSAMLWIYYAFQKGDDFLLVTINTVGCFIETIYIVMYIAYAPRKARIFTSKLVLLLNMGVFCLILLLAQLLATGSRRVQVLGWVCVAFSVSVFVAPLSIMRLVIRTKSVEFMPFSLSFFLTLTAVMWFSYGVLKKDYYIALPNVLGFVFSVLQMILYIIYRDTKKVIQEQKLPVDVTDIIKSTTMGSSEGHQVDTRNEKINISDEDQNSHELTTRGSKESIRPPNEVQLSECQV